MKFSVSREVLLQPLQLVAGVVERRQTMAVLANTLMVLEGNSLSLTGTDLEVEIIGRLQVNESQGDGEITVPAKKLLDICRSLPESAELNFSLDSQKVVVKSGRSRFTLSTLPANDFPNVERGQGELQFSCRQGEVKRLIDRTAFAMAQQDVRYYLNGMLWEVRSGQLRCVSTDGHRLAMCSREMDVDVPNKVQAILPRKGVIELSRLLEESDEAVEVVLSDHHIRVTTEGYTFTSKLVDGKFPDYDRVMPANGDKVVFGDRRELKEAFSRTAILSNEKYRGVRLLLSDNQLTLVANNPEQEEAEEQVTVEYTGEEMEMGFNVVYLQDVMNVLSTEKVKITLSNADSSALIEEPEDGDSVYVVMPMKL